MGHGAWGLLALAGALPGVAQPPANAPRRAQVLKAAREVIAKARYATFVTVDDAGRPQARIVDPAPPEGEVFHVWFATNVRTRKVAELKADGRSALAWFDRGGMATLTLRGRAEVVADPAEKARRWRKAWAPFYPGGASDPDLVLIRFQPSSLEISSPRHRLANDPATWRPVILSFE
jgi:general stress protein 26